MITAVSIISVDAIIVKQINLLRYRRPRLYSVSPCAHILSLIFLNFIINAISSSFTAILSITTTPLSMCTSKHCSNLFG